MRVVVLLSFASLITVAVTAGGSAGAFPGFNGKIAFSSFRDGNYEIYSMNPDGIGQTNLSNDPAYDSNPHWSADGTRLAFTGTRNGNYEIYTMNADGSDVTRLTNNPALDLFPSWSPDGTRIAFMSERDGNREIYTMNPDGSGVLKLTDTPLGYSNGDPAWSPDGTKIAFDSRRSAPNNEIYVMNVDGSGQTNLTNESHDDYAPSWSPDGTRIAFSSSRDDVSGEIYSMYADGTGVTRLTNSPAVDSAPAWSPDGTKIAFHTNRNGGGNWEIYVMNVDGSNQLNRTNHEAYDCCPDWQAVLAPPPPPPPPRIQPRARYTGADYQTGGIGLRNQRRGVITINGVSAPPVARFVYWAIINPTPPTIETAALTRLWPPGSGSSTTLSGYSVGQDAACSGGGLVTVYRAVVSSPSVVPGNGVYMIDLLDTPSGGEDPWVSSPTPRALGASLVVVYQSTGTTMLYDLGFSGHPFDSNTGYGYGLATIPYPGGHAHWDEIGAEGQKGTSRSASPSIADEKTTVNGLPGSAGPLVVAGPGSAANDSDWNGNDSTPLPSLWDTRGHDISAALSTGDTTLDVVTGLSPSGGGDCLTSVANVLHYG
jgi:Tol biopolymer transport system component